MKTIQEYLHPAGFIMYWRLNQYIALPSFVKFEKEWSLPRNISYEMSIPF